ncbi:phage portal protein, partial [Enterocloster citroniae]|nr:phage portal protein [Enterocloster citroniae]
TEIKTSRQRSYVMVSDTQMALQDALEDLVYAMSFWAALYGLIPAGNDYEVSSDWDDSVIVDAELERQTDRADVAMGAMSLAEYRAKWYGETLEEAAKNLPEPALTEE